MLKVVSNRALIITKLANDKYMLVLNVIKHLKLPKFLFVTLK